MQRHSCARSSRCVRVLQSPRLTRTRHFQHNLRSPRQISADLGLACFARALPCVIGWRQLELDCSTRSRSLVREDSSARVAHTGHSRLEIRSSARSVGYSGISAMRWIAQVPGWMSMQGSTRRSRTSMMPLDLPRAWQRIHASRAPLACKASCQPWHSCVPVP